MRRKVDDFAGLLRLEMGKLISEAKAEVELSAAIFEYYAKMPNGSEDAAGR